VNFGEGGSVKAKMTIALVSVLAAAGLLVAGCGGGSSSTTTAGSASTAGGASTPSESSATESQQAGGGAVPSEAVSAATGDIPDTQTFLLFHDPQAGYSIRYPEGWARKGSANDVTFQEKANVIHIAVGKGAPRSKPGVKVTSSRMSAADPVTGKRLRIVVDRYEYGKGGKVAVLELSTPVGVDNVDAYRMISESFKWQ
jgi:hypothetical protein